VPVSLDWFQVHAGKWTLHGESVLF